MQSGPLAKQIRSWLSRPIREALLDFPDVWLSVQGKTMALTLYGAVSALIGQGIAGRGEVESGEISSDQRV